MAGGVRSMWSTWLECAGQARMTAVMAYMALPAIRSAARTHVDVLTPCVNLGLCPPWTESDCGQPQPLRHIQGDLVSLVEWSI